MNPVQKLKLNELGRLNLQEFIEAIKFPYAIILDNVRSMHNVGSVFRTADAFRAEKIALCGITATPPHREITKTAIGAEKSVHWQYFKQTIDAVKHFKELGYKIIAIEQTNASKDLKELSNAEEKVVFIFGNEIDGVMQEVIEICDECIEIPQAGTKHSLNISVSVGIILWQYCKNWL